MDGVKEVTYALHSIYEVYLDEVLNLKGKSVKPQVASRLKKITVEDSDMPGVIAYVTIHQNHEGKHKEFKLGIQDGNIDTEMYLESSTRRKIYAHCIDLVRGIMNVGDVYLVVLDNVGGTIGFKFESGDTKVYPIRG